MLNICLSSDGHTCCSKPKCLCFRNINPLLPYSVIFHLKIFPNSFYNSAACWWYTALRRNSSQWHFIYNCIILLQSCTWERREVYLKKGKSFWSTNTFCVWLTTDCTVLQIFKMLHILLYHIYHTVKLYSCHILLVSFQYEKAINSLCTSTCMAWQCWALALM